MDCAHEIFGIGFNELKNFNEFFYVICEYGEETIYVSKETFKHEEEDFNFEYKYIVDVIFCKGKTFYSLELAVLPKYICKELKEKILSSCGIEDENDIVLTDCLSYGGCSVTFGSINNEEEKIDEYILNKIASVFITMDSLRGFYLDKAQNSIGTNGWDILESCIKNKPWF